MAHDSNLQDRRERLLIGALGLAANALVAQGDPQSLLVAVGLSQLIKSVCDELGYDAKSNSFLLAVQDEAHAFITEELLKGK